MSSKRSVALATALIFWSQIEQASAVEFEPIKNALISLLGSPKVMRKVLDDGHGHTSQVFYIKGAKGASKVAVIEKGLYEPDCTHTWAIGLDAITGKVTQVRTIEMKCPHAFPCKAASFLDQYTGKGPADISKLSAEINTIAKATASAILVTDAVKRSITAYQKVKSTL